MKWIALISFSLLANFLTAQPFFPDLEGNALIQAIRNEFRPSNVLSYNDARDLLYGNIDRVNDSLYCVYTGFGIQMTPGADPSSDAFSKGINTEHTWPRSKGADSGNPNSDMHHLFPTRLGVNSDRASLPFGDISDNATSRWYYLQFENSSPPQVAIRDLYSELLTNVRFEPREDHKGNVARAMFYFYTVYRSEANAADPNYFQSQINDLCDWHAQDPVDSRELQRTEAIALHQSGKVNPFVVDCNLLMRAYCPSLQPTACFSSVDDPSAPVAPFEILGVGRNDANERYIMIAADKEVQLHLEWYDVLGRKVSFEERDWLGAGTFQLLLTNEVANTIQGSAAPCVARLRFVTNDGSSWVKSVMVP